ncbi:MAG: hypothetical protein OK449_06335 [Thaumarchaeota archaeon]|nr:hypothetical protein [Nitrososphaerota archaeon]
MNPRLPNYYMLVLTILVGVTVALGLAQLTPLTFLYSYAYFANISGYLALILIAATGVLMLFRRPLLRYLKDPELLRNIHVTVAGLGGAFLVVHVVFFLLFPLSLPVLFGYFATYAALAIWITGALLLEGLRNSIFYHGLLSLVGISLMVVHVFSAGRGFPEVVSGVVLVLIASSVLAVSVKRFLDLSTAMKKK